MDMPKPPATAGSQPADLRSAGGPSPDAKADSTPDLSEYAGPIRARLDAVNAAREAGLAACRQTIRSCGSAIRAVHRRNPERAAALTLEAATSLRRAQEALSPYPEIAYAGFLH